MPLVYRVCTDIVQIFVFAHRVEERIEGWIEEAVGDHEPHAGVDCVLRSERAATLAHLREHRDHEFTATPVGLLFPHVAHSSVADALEEEVEVVQICLLDALGRELVAVG